MWRLFGLSDGQSEEVIRWLVVVRNKQRFGQLIVLKLVRDNQYARMTIQIKFISCSRALVT